MNSQTIGRWIRDPWLWSILALAVLVRFYGSTTSAIWCDEGSSLLMSQYSPALIWFHSAHDVHPPLYYLLLHGWINLFGNGIFSIRAMSVLPGIATVPLGIWLVRLIATRQAALLAGLLLALLPIAVRYSQEVRMYSLMGFWLLGATIALVYWVKRPDRTRYLVAYSLLMAASFYTHYFTGLCVLSHWFYLWLIRGDQQRLIMRRAWWISNGVIVALYAPWIPSLIDQLQHLDQLKVGGDVGWIPALTPYSLPSTLWQFMTLSDGLDLWWPVYGLLPLALVTIAGLVAWRDRAPDKLHTLVVAYTFVPLVVVYLVSFITPLLVERYVMFAAIGLPLIIAILIDQLRDRRRYLAIALLALVTTVEVVGLNSDYSAPDEQFDTLVNFVNQHQAAGDRVVISDICFYFTYAYYDKSGSRPQLYTPPMPNGTPGRPNNYGFGTLVDDDANRIYLDSLKGLPNDVHRIWLIGGSEPTDDFASIPKGWTKLTEHSIGEVSARLYSSSTRTAASR